MSDNSNQYTQSDELKKYLDSNGSPLDAWDEKMLRTLQHREDLVLERVALEHTIATLKESLKKAEATLNDQRIRENSRGDTKELLEAMTSAQQRTSARLEEARRILYEVMKFRGR